MFFPRKAAFWDDRSNFKFNSQCAPKINGKEPEKYGIVSKQFLHGNVLASQKFYSKWIPPGAVSSMPVASMCGSIFEDDHSLFESRSSQAEFNRVDYLVRVLHESSRSFSLAMQTLELARTGPPLAMAWNGVDVHAWHKHIAYQVSVVIENR